MNTYLITGVASFIGFHVAQLLLEDGHQIIGIDEMQPLSATKMKEWRLEQLKEKYDKQITVFPFSISDRWAIEQVFNEIKGWGKSIDAIIHLSANSSSLNSIIDPWESIASNYIATQNLLEICRTYSIPKFILASTARLYGNSNHPPFFETDDTSQPLSPFAASKKAAECLCYTYHHLYQLDISILRYFTLYGPGEGSETTISKFMSQIKQEKELTLFGNGEQQLDFIFIEDAAKGTIAALKKVGYEIFNLGADEPHHLIDIVKLIEEISEITAQVVYQEKRILDVPTIWGNIEKAKLILDWEPKIKILEGIQKTWNWYESSGFTIHKP